MPGLPASAAEKAALFPEFDTICIEPVPLGINVDCGSKRMIAELRSPSVLIDRPFASADSVTNNTIDGKTGVDHLLKGLPDVLGIKPAHLKRRDIFDADGYLILLAHGAL